MEIQDAKIRKKSPSAPHRTTLSSYIFATEACIDNRKKNFKQQYLLHISLQYGEFWPTNGWDRFESLRHPSKFQRVSRPGFVTAATSLTGGQPNFARCLAVSWAATLYTFSGALAPCRNFARCKIHFASKSCGTLAFSNIGSVTARHSSSWRQPYIAAWYKEWN